MIPQPLHIARKDLLHLWPETLVVLALFAAFVWAAPSGWQQSQYAPVAALVSVLLKVLMPVSWLVLISRLIHDEPLVGDRQFWTSRPYHWGSLLAAKVLYLLAFIYLPFLLMQVILLKHAGLYPTTAIPALLHNLLLLTVFVIIPFAAIAAVTATFTRLLLSALAGAIYLLIVAGVVGYMVFERMPPTILTNVWVALFIVLPAAALIYQYATRRTVISRALLIATPLLIALVTFLILAPSAALIRSEFPLAASSSDPKLSDFPDALRPQQASPGRLITFRNQAQVELPFSVANVDKDSAYLVKGASVTFGATGGTSTLPFNKPGNPIEITNGVPISAVALPIPVALFNKIHATPTDVHLALATEHLQLEKPSVWKAGLLPFAVPGHGICSYSADSPDALPTCRYPLKTPEISFVTASLAPGQCGLPGGQTVPGSASLGGHTETLDFDPVISVPLSFRTGDPDPKHRYILCPGSPLTFLEAKSQGRARLEVEIKQIVLDNFAARIPQQTPAP